MTVSEFHKLPAGGFGWRTLPDGRKLKIGSSVINETALLGDYVEIGDGAVIGATTQIGRQSNIGESAVISHYAEIGHHTSIGSHAKIGQYSHIGDRVVIGDQAEIGSIVKILNRAEIGANVKLHRTPLQIQGPEYLLYPHSPGFLGIGCTIHSFEEWEKLGEQIAEDEDVKYADYRPLVEIMIRWMKENMP
jgi:acyl-[acyl carrier protein]--UDP-N-acetylglucosamine O-acyltransferase